MMRRCCVRVWRTGRSGDRLLLTLRIVGETEMLAKSSTLHNLHFTSPQLSVALTSALTYSVHPAHGLSVNRACRRQDSVGCWPLGLADCRWQRGGERPSRLPWQGIDSPGEDSGISQDWAGLDGGWGL